MTIRTYSERTPWGIEWTAIDDNFYDGGNHGVGIGPTEEAAIADMWIGLEDLFCPECKSGPGEAHSIHCELEHG